MQAIVLGSGMSDFVNHFEIIERIDYSEMVPFDFKNLDGHERILYHARYLEQEFIILSGRFHFYEGLSPNDINYVLNYAIKKYNLNQIILCAASGALSKKIIIGEWYQVNEFICFPQIAINNSYRSIESNDILKTCIYAYHQGPSLGTKAEYKMLNKMGAQLIGMSLYPEAGYLKNKNINVVCLSVAVCQYQPFDNCKEPSHLEVTQIADKATSSLVSIFKKIIQ